MCGAAITKDHKGQTIIAFSILLSMGHLVDIKHTTSIADVRTTSVSTKEKKGQTVFNTLLSREHLADKGRIKHPTCIAHVRTKSVKSQKTTRDNNNNIHTVQYVGKAGTKQPTTYPLVAGSTNAVQISSERSMEQATKSTEHSLRYWCTSRGCRVHNQGPWDIWNG